MIDDFDKILDECIDAINRGQSLESCLNDYPDYQERLKPLLQAVLQTREAYRFVPSQSAKWAAQQRFETARQKRLQTEEKEPSFLARLFGRPLAWAAVTTAILAALALYFGLNQAFYPTIVPTADPEGNFVLLISDDVNAIGDFESLIVTIDKVSILGDSGKQFEFEPEVKEVDLTSVPGAATQQIWRGNINEGGYSKVILYIESVQGVLKESKVPEGKGSTVEVKLPSQKLQIAKAFQVTADTVTSFTFDVTVVSAGNEHSGIKYILKPQADQSGADVKPAKVKGNKS